MKPFLCGGAKLCTLSSCKLTQQLLLLLSELLRYFYEDLDDLIARSSGSHVRQALILEFDDLAVLCSGGISSLSVPLSVGTSTDASKCCLDETDRKLTDQIVVVPGEHVVLLDSNVDVQIARRPTGLSSFHLRRRCEPPALRERQREF